MTRKKAAYIFFSIIYKLILNDFLPLIFIVQNLEIVEI